MNKVILMGRLVKDIETRQTQTNKLVGRFSIAVPRRFAKEGQQQADFINCIVWGKTAEFVNKYFAKGSMIAVVGSIQSRSWDDESGTKHFATEVLVDEVYFAGAKKSDAPTQQNNNSSAGNAVTGNNAGNQATGNLDTSFADAFNENGFADFGDISEDDLPF